jgi:hypothetical protein
MVFRNFRHMRILLLAASWAVASTAQAQTGGWQPFVSATPVYQGDGDLDGGGDFNAQGVIVFAGVSGSVGNGSRAGVTLNYSYTDYTFSNPAGFGGTAPWDAVQRYGMSVPLAFGLSDGWSIGLTPGVDWFRETGADMDDSLVWSGIVSASRRFDDGNRLGVGVIVADRIEKTRIFPLLLVDWRISERWRLLNPLPAGPTGPAGLELDYRFDNGWNLGIGVGFYNSRFRLSTAGVAPDGVGEVQSRPVFLRATRAMGERMSLNLYAGMLLGGELQVEDAAGETVNEVDFDPAPFLGATFLARF